MTIDYDAIQEVAVDDAKARIMGWLVKLRIPVTMWAEGGVGEAAVEIGANLWNELSKIAVALKKFAVGDDSYGTALDLWSWNVFRHTRNPGEYAVHRVYLSCTGTNGPYTLNKGDVIVTDGTSSFWLDEMITGSFPFVLTSGMVQPFLFKCGQRGIAGNSAVGAINRLGVTMLGVTCNNPEALAGSGTSLWAAGSDRETDDQLKDRNATKWATRNPLELVNDSYEYFAKAAAPAVTRVTVIDTNPRGPNTVDLILASDSGGVGVLDVAAVETDIRRRVLGTVSVNAYSAPTTAINLVGTIYYSADFTEAQAKAQAKVALDAALAACDIGGKNLVGLGTNVVPVSVLTDALDVAKVGDVKCIKAHAITSPTSYVTLTPTSVAVLGTWPPTGVSWVPVS
jgi:hypothetical protein